MQNQPYTPQNQPYLPQQSFGENSRPFATQQPGMQQPGMQQPGMQQPATPQPSMQPPPSFQLNSQPNTNLQPTPTSPPAALQSNGNAMPALSPPRQIRPAGSPPLDGAGIVQRAAATSPNGPRYVLLAPNGRILAYLQPDRGISLDLYVGRQMGIMGVRAYQPELQTDLIIVRSMIPVRLVQP
jgi:hypothetical protein